MSIFHGVVATSALKAAALDPDPENSDNLMNVIYLCHNCHVLLDKPLVSLVPQILEDPTTIFPYDPRAVDHYDVVVEFPGGLEPANIAVLQEDKEYKRMRPGHVLTLRTADPATLPLPHPLLLQLHVVCSRMVVIRAAAGYPVLIDGSSDGDTVYDPLEVADVKQFYGEFGGKDESRDPEIVILELDQRKYEQEQLLLKLGGRVNVMGSAATG